MVPDMLVGNLKFDHLLNRARELGCDYIATGHYVQRWQDENGRWGPVSYTHLDVYKRQG